MDECYNFNWGNSADVIEDGEIVYDAETEEILPGSTEEIIYDGDATQILADQTEEIICDTETTEIPAEEHPVLELGPEFPKKQQSSQDNFSIFPTESQVTEEVVIDQWEGNFTEEVVAYEQPPTEDVPVPIPLQQDEYITLRPFPCDFCNKRFRSMTSLINHMAAHQKTHNYHECSKCRVRFISKSDLSLHKKIHEKSSVNDSKFSIVGNRRSFVCEHCGVGFIEEKVLKSHLRIHEGKSAFACQKCDKNFWDMRSLVEHRRVTHGDVERHRRVDNKQKNKYGTYSCTICGISFCRQDDLKRHQQNHLEDSLDTESGFICKVCGESFAEPLDLLAHAEEHARGFEYRCMVCSENFIDEEACALHVQEQHPEEEGLNCTECSRVFYDATRLEKHMLSHQSKTFLNDGCPDERINRHVLGKLSDQQFLCQECGKKFATRSSQQIHMRIHTGERPYACGFCDKAFTDGGTLRKHERIHTGEKPYACVVCPKAFNQRVVLREHIRSHHSGPDPKYSQSTTPFCCSVCSDMFSESQDLIVHLIHHCDINTAMKRQPKVGPRKYVRRTKSKSEYFSRVKDEPVHEEYETQDESVEEEVQPRGSGETPKYEIDMDTNWTRRMRKSPEFGENYIEEGMSPSTSILESPTRPEIHNAEFEGELRRNSVTTSRAKMIHTEKKPKSNNSLEMKGRRHKSKFTTKRTFPEFPESVRPRTKNVTYPICDKPSLATFSEEGTDPLNTPRKKRKKKFNHDPYETSEVVSEQTKEIETDRIEENGTRRSSRKTRRSKSRHNIDNVDKEGEKISKKSVREEQSVDVSDIKQEYEQCEEQIVYETPEYYAIPEGNSLPKECPETIFEDNGAGKECREINQLKPEAQKPENTNVKQEFIDPLLELAEISMQHAKSLFQCEMCYAVFLERSQLLNHVRVHI